MIDRGFKKKYHRMTPITDFLMDIIQILFRDWIEKTIADIGRCNFFTIEDAFLFCVAVKIYNVGGLGFFVRAQPKLCFGWHRHGFLFLARKTLANLGRKTWFTGTDRKKCLPTSAKKDDRSRFEKEASPDDADRKFPNRHHQNIIQGLNTKDNSQLG